MIIYDDSDPVVCETEDGDSDNEFTKKLSEIVCTNSRREQRLCKQVEIYWPIPMLQVKVLVFPVFVV